MAVGAQIHHPFSSSATKDQMEVSSRQKAQSSAFKAVNETLLEFGGRRFGGTVGIIALAYLGSNAQRPFSSALCYPRGRALSFDQTRWMAARQNFLFPVKALSVVFRGKFLDGFKEAFEHGKIPSATEALKELRKKYWVVYAKKPFGSPETVLDYLGRYTHRVALSNDRILKAQNGEVTFSYRDRRDGDRKKTIALDADEFIRRFLLHVLPDRFVRVRHFGFLANRAKKHALSQCRKLLGLNPALPEIPKRSARELLHELTGIDLARCPSCHRGTMMIMVELPPLSESPRWDSS